MPTINGKVCVVDGVAVDKVFSDGRQVYGRNLLTGTSNDIKSTNGQATMQGASASITGVYSRTDSYEQVTAPSSGEFYYRFMVPNVNILYGLTPEETYTLSGSVSHTAGTLKFRPGYSLNGSNWAGTAVTSDLGIPVSDGSVFVPFSYAFTVPAGATGIYFSLQNYDYTAGSLFRFKNMKLEKGSIATPWSPAPEDVLKGDVTTPNNLVVKPINAITDKLDWE